MVSPHYPVSMMQGNPLSDGQAVNIRPGIGEWLHEQPAVLYGYHTMFRLNSKPRELNVLLHRCLSPTNQSSILKMHKTKELIY
jgi:hypothetical protein